VEEARLMTKVRNESPAKATTIRSLFNDMKINAKRIEPDNAQSIGNDEL
jgi:hypothetical protein